ncbi:hypothetical protein [Halomicrobium salinisoli]|uniref:hypothetical protein n=1 Tax=Halomicrobium salinisoli TaxID=2878391 RepID=UPI001CF06E95|nr:hypothetical protein [Halomicrobium salinisoli]
MPITAVVPIVMSVSKSLLAVLAVLLVAGTGAAATGIVQTDSGASAASVSDLEMDATLDNETVTVTMIDGGQPVENASITVEGDREGTLTTDADGTATVNLSTLTEDDESLEELEIEYESDHAEGELEYVVEDGSLTLVEEKYEYQVDHEEDEADDDESESDDEREESENDDGVEDDEEGDDEEEDEESDDDETEANA